MRPFHFVDKFESVSPRTVILKQDLVILHVFLLLKFATLLSNNWLAETPQMLALMRLGRQSAGANF